MTVKQNRSNHPNFYEFALLFADGQSRPKEERRGTFIDNLSRICDEFASHISLKERHDLTHCNQVIVTPEFGSFSDTNRV